MKWYLAVLLTLLCGVANASASPVIINEVDADNAGIDTREFIELFDGGSGNTALDGMVLVLFNGATDSAYNSFDLSGYATRGTGYFVIGSAAISPDFVVSADGWLQNGADAVALYAGNSQDFPVGTAVAATNLLDAFVYDTNDADDAELLQLLNLGQPQVNEDEGGNAALFSSQRYPDGSGGGRNTASYYQAVPTPGYGNGDMAAVPAPAPIILLLSGVLGLTSVKRRKGGR